MGFCKTFLSSILGILNWINCGERGFRLNLNISWKFPILPNKEFKWNFIPEDSPSTHYTHNKFFVDVFWNKPAWKFLHTIYEWEGILCRKTFIKKKPAGGGSIKNYLGSQNACFCNPHVQTTKTQFSADVIIDFSLLYSTVQKNEIGTHRKFRAQKKSFLMTKVSMGKWKMNGNET